MNKQTVLDITGQQTLDKVGKLLWAWLSCAIKLVDKIIEPYHKATDTVCHPL